MSNIILCNIADAIKTIEESRSDWLNDTLTSLGITSEILAIRDIRDLRYNISDTMGIEIEIKSNGEIDVYKKQWNDHKIEELRGWLPIKKDHLVAQWKEPTRIRKIEGKEVYYELHLNEWSIANLRGK